MTKDNEYILGTGNDELERLSLQHRIWSDAAVASWKRAGIGPNTRVIDLGCGPGFASYDLAQLVGYDGEVLAIDESKSFIDFVNSQAQTRNLPQLKAQLGDVQNLNVTSQLEKKFDAVYCRWVLCWLAEPAKAIEKIKSFLKPGGKLIIHDYFNWAAMTSAPRSAALEKVVAAAIESFRDRSGDIDICAKLPPLLRQKGYKLIHFQVDQRVARGGGLDSTLAWPLTWWRTYAPKLVTLGKLSSQDCEQALRDLENLEQDPDQFFFCPPVFELIAEIKER